MEVVRHWRLKKQRYTLTGVICPRCSARLFPPRDVCPHCASEPKEHPDYRLEAPLFAVVDQMEHAGR